MTVTKITLGVEVRGRVAASGNASTSEPSLSTKRQRDPRAAIDTSSAPSDGDALKARARLIIEQARMSLRRPSDGTK